MSANPRGGQVHSRTAEVRKEFLDATRPIFDEIGAASGEVGQSFEKKLSVYW